MQYKIGDKITLKEFFDSEEVLVIHCHTEEKANKLLKEFDKLGKVWRNGDKYIENNQYITYNNSTCYNNEGGFCTLGYYLNRNYKIYEFDDIIFEEQPKNLMPLIAKELGVEIGERFQVSHASGTFYFENYYLLEDGLRKGLNNFISDNEHTRLNAILPELINGNWKIEKLPPKPRLTEVEKVILENLPKEYKYIARDDCGELYVYENKPIKGGNEWDRFGSDYFNNLNLFQHLFKFIKWEDKEPYKIQELLEEYENLRSE